MSLGNRGIDGPIPLSSVPTFASQHTASSVGGTLQETTLYSATIPGGLLGTNGILTVTTLWTWTNSANNKAMKVKFGTASYLSSIATTSTGGQTKTIIRNRNSNSSQVGSSSSSFLTYSAGTVVTTSSINTAADVVLTCTGTTTLETGFTPVTTNMSGNGATVTVIQTAHGLLTGEYVKASGSSTAGYNVDPVAITRVDANTFTYAGTGTGTPVTSPTIQRYSVITLEAIYVEVLN